MGPSRARRPHRIHEVRRRADGREPARRSRDEGARAGDDRGSGARAIPPRCRLGGMAAHRRGRTRARRVARPRTHQDRGPRRDSHSRPRRGALRRDREGGQPMTFAATTLAESFNTAFREHPAGIALITATTPAGPVGLTASSVASLGIDPVALSFSVTRTTGSAGGLLAAESYLVHLLD